MRGLLLLFTFAIAQVAIGQMSFDDWQLESQSNKRLLPKYGGAKKTKTEKKSDADFIESAMSQFDTRREASDHMIDLGFNYYYRGDLKTAMYRFNQAYLLDAENANIYWGYGAIYMAFGEFELSREQYDEGLKIDPKNDKILIDYGTTYLGEYYNFAQSDTAKANEFLDKSIELLSEAYAVDPDNANSSYKLSICYMYQNNCEKATEYLSLSEEIGNPNITESFKLELEEKCTEADFDCSGIRTGKFRSYDEEAGETIIERTEEYQIEENTKQGYTLKLEVIWLDDCTYQLKPVPGSDDPMPSMTLTCKITELTENGYIQISSSDVSPMRLKTELTRID